MKKSLTRLPKNKKAELEKISNIIRELCNDVEMIILFGSYARGDWKEESDLKPDRKFGHVSDKDNKFLNKRFQKFLFNLLWV